MSTLFSRLFTPNEPSPKTPATPYEQLGGAEAVRMLADKFYDIMETRADAQALLDIHAQPLTGIRQKFYEFLSGWLGGPRLFEEKYGHPRLRMRHMPFQIGTELRDQWLLCMYQALDEVVSDELLRMQLRAQFTALANHMVNHEGP